MTCIAFSDEQKAVTFERSLTSGSGHAPPAKGNGERGAMLIGKPLR